MKRRFTGAPDMDDFRTVISTDSDYVLSAEEQTLFVNVTLTAASKSLTLGLGEGDTMLVTNIGSTNAVTVKAIAGDTGTSLAAGKCAICIGSATANASKVLVLN